MKKEKLYLKILQASQKTGVPVKKLMDVFYILRLGKAINNKKLQMKVGVSKKALNLVKKRLASLLKPTSQNTQLKETKLKEINQVFKGLNYKVEENLLSLQKDKKFKTIVKLLKKYSAFQPEPKREYDQFTATPETSAKRAIMLNFLADIKGKKILFLGDDDFTSIAIASLGQAQNITVLDIDKQILKGIRTISDKEDYNIEVIKYDARNPLKQSLKAKFDVVFTDPPYTPKGIKLFISRAISALGSKNQTARLYFCFGNSDRAKERFLPIYELVIESGLMIRWIFDKFNRYNGAESIGSSSSLFICETTPKTKSLIQGNYDKPIYTFN